MSQLKINTLLAQKEKLEKQLKAETEKRLLQIGRIAKKENILFWSDASLKNLFKEANSQGEDHYKIKEIEKTEKPKDKKTKK